MYPNFCQAFLAEFLAMCSVGGTATLTFSRISTTKGLTNTNFNVSHGAPLPFHPGAPGASLPCYPVAPGPPHPHQLGAPGATNLRHLDAKSRHQEEGQRSRQNHVACGGGGEEELAGAGLEEGKRSSSATL